MGASTKVIGWNYLHLQCARQLMREDDKCLLGQDINDGAAWSIANLMLQILSPVEASCRVPPLTYSLGLARYA
jgi:hypothetical protein